MESLVGSLVGSGVGVGLGIWTEEVIVEVVKSLSPEGVGGVIWRYVKKSFLLTRI